MTQHVELNPLNAPGQVRGLWCRAGAVVAAAAMLSACGGSDSAEPAAPTPEPTSLKAQGACSTLAGQTVAASAIGVPSGVATVTTAELVAPKTPVTETVVFDPRLGLTTTRTTVATPEFCKVVGRIAPVDPAAPPINFQVNLPTDWNLKAAQLGGGGLNGSIPASLNTGFNAPESQPAGVGSPLQRGYMEMGSDSGHSSATPTWTLNDESAANLAHLQMKKTRDVAVALARTYYGAAPKRVYFLGSSQGGREALIVVQKYPADYDGAFSQVPIIGFSSITLNPTVLAQKQTGAGWIRPAQRTLIGNEVLRQCDALDGAVDGVVSAYLACNARFVDLPAAAPTPWAAIRCADGTDLGDTCLSDAQITALRAVHSLIDYGYPLAFGAPGWAGWGVGGELRGWHNYATQPTDSYSGGLGGIWFKGQIFRDLAQPAMTWNPTTYKTQLLALSALSDATDPNLAAFHARGGKLIMKANSADYVANYRELIRYHEQMVSVMGQTRVDQFARLYIAPGQTHSMSGNQTQRGAYGAVIPSQIDMLQVLDDWVTGKAAPSDALVMEERSLVTPFTVSASLPLCRYPAYPHYRGGDRALASSYSCQQ